MSSKVDIALLTGLVKDLRGTETFAPAQVEMYNIRLTDAMNTVKRKGMSKWLQGADDEPVIQLIPEGDGYAISEGGSIYWLKSTPSLELYTSSFLANVPTWTKYKGEIIIATGNHPLLINGTTISQLPGNPPLGKFIATISSLTVLAGIVGDDTIFYWCDSNNPKSWPTTKFANIQDTGTIQYMTAYKDRLLFFKEDETEVWNFVGGSDPFIRYPGGDISQGLGAKNSVVHANDRVYWFGHEGDFYVYEGGVAKVKSGGMRRKLDEMNNLDDLIGFDLRKESCVMWTNPTDGVTFLYDYKRDKWLEDKFSVDSVLEAMPFKSYMEKDRKQYFGNSHNTGWIYEWSEDNKDDDGAPIVITRRFKTRLSRGDNRIRMERLMLRREGSMATSSVTSPVLQIRYRWDEGVWSKWRQESLGAVGKHDPYAVELRGLGMGRDFELEIRQSDATDFVMTNAIATFTEMM